MGIATLNSLSAQLTPDCVKSQIPIFATDNYYLKAQKDNKKLEISIESD